MPEKRTPVAPVNSVRVLLYRAGKPLSLIVRQSSNGSRWGLLGGKIEFGEPIEKRVVEEVQEEAEIERVSDIRPVTSVYVPNKLLSYTLPKWQALGYAVDLIDRKAESIVLANQVIIVFAAWTDDPLPDHEVEGREIAELDIRPEGNLERIKARHRVIAHAWRENLLRGKAIPPLLFHEENGE